jgi:hypothetical protein
MNLNLYNKGHIAQYHGKGYLILQDGHHADCTFFACQFFNGKIYILCKFISLDAGIMSYRKYAIRLEGETSDGYFIYGSGNFNYISGEMGTNNSATYLISNLSVTRDKNVIANKLVFGLTNLELDGRKHMLELEINQNGIVECVTVELVPMNDYALIISQLEALNDVNVTYQAIIEINKKEDSWTLERLVEDLCYLLSVAQGTKIQWIYINRIGDENCILSSLHSNRHTKRYNPSTLIHAQDVETFIKIAHKVYEEKRIALKLDKGLIDAYLDAQSQEDYIETRAVKLAVTIEMLKATLLELPEYELNEYILNKDYFEDQIAPKLCDSVREILKSNPADTNQENSMTAELDCIHHINCINRVSFRRILRKICKFIYPDLNKDINKFVNSRNSLVHNARFYCQSIDPKCDNSEKVKEYFFLINFINILLLRLLGYTGNYYDYGDIHNIQMKKL